MIKLGVNIDHVATLRNARGEGYPDVVRAAHIAKQAGADNITVHLREDRRHIRDDDVWRLKEEVNIPINLEIALEEQMVDIALQLRPHSVCFVPEKRQEITTEGGLNTAIKTDYLKKTTADLKNRGIKVSYFIEPDIHIVKQCYALGGDCIEIHTGLYAQYCNQHKELEKNKILSAIHEAVKTAKDCHLDIHAGHGLNYANVADIAAIQDITCLNIGHFLISEALFIGLSEAITRMKKSMQTAHTINNHISV